MPNIDGFAKKRSCISHRIQSAIILHTDLQTSVQLPQSNFKPNPYATQNAYHRFKISQEHIVVQSKGSRLPCFENAPYTQKIPNRSNIDRHYNCKISQNITNNYDKQNTRSEVQNKTPQTKLQIEKKGKKYPPFLLKREVGQNVLSFPLFLRLLCTKASQRSPKTWWLSCLFWPTFSWFRPQKLRWSKRSSRHESQDPSSSALPSSICSKYLKHICSFLADPKYEPSLSINIFMKRKEELWIWNHLCLMVCHVKICCLLITKF